MHSSRMPTACSSSRLGGSPPGTPHTEQALPRTRDPPGAGTPLGPGTPPPDLAPPEPDPPQNFPLGCGPGPDPPQFPPWLWAWTRSPSISPLAVGLDQIPSTSPLGVGLETPPGDLLQGMLGYHLQCMLG